MNNQELQYAIQEDLKVIPHLKLPILTAKKAYLPLVYSYFIFLGIAFSVLTINVIFMFLQERYNPARLIPDYLGSLCLFSIFYLFIGSSIHSFVMFHQMVKGQLKTERFITQKFKAYLMVYTAIYFILFSVTFFFNCRSYYADPNDFFFNGLVVSNFVGFIVGALISSMILNMEVERLGLGALLNVMTEVLEHKDRLKKGAAIE